MISPDGGRSKLALFEGNPQGSRTTAGFHRVAFRVSGDEWYGHRLEVTTYEVNVVRKVGPKL
jgi:hypothetical protein